jgi:hypothetical protein
MLLMKFRDSLNACFSESGTASCRSAAPCSWLVGVPSLPTSAYHGRCSTAGHDATIALRAFSLSGKLQCMHTWQSRSAYCLHSALMHRMWKKTRSPREFLQPSAPRISYSSAWNLAAVTGVMCHSCERTEFASFRCCAGSLSPSTVNEPTLKSTPSMAASTPSSVGCVSSAQMASCRPGAVSRTWARRTDGPSGPVPLQPCGNDDDPAGV